MPKLLQYLQRALYSRGPSKRRTAVNSLFSGAVSRPPSSKIQVTPSTALTSPNIAQPAVTGHNTLSYILQRPALIIGRQLEYMNIFLGFEQANRYAIHDPNTAECIGYILEDGTSHLMRMVQRQILRTHRPFTATILSTEGVPLMRLQRPFYFINSRLFISKPSDNYLNSPTDPHSIEWTELGEVQQQWHLIRRRYDLFLEKSQFAAIDAPLLSWEFDMVDASNSLLGRINKNFVGFGRELFTDSSQYMLAFDDERMSVEQRAIMLGCAISVDFDFFSRHSSGGAMGWWPFLTGGSDHS